MDNMKVHGVYHLLSEALHMSHWDQSEHKAPMTPEQRRPSMLVTTDCEGHAERTTRLQHRHAEVVPSAKFLCSAPGTLGCPCRAVEGDLIFTARGFLCRVADTICPASKGGALPASSKGVPCHPWRAGWLAGAASGATAGTAARTTPRRPSPRPSCSRPPSGAPCQSQHTSQDCRNGPDRA